MTALDLVRKLLDQVQHQGMYQDMEVEFEIPPMNSKDIITLSDINSIHTAIWHGESKSIKKVIIQLY